VADLEYKPPIPRPAYASGKGPRVAIDEAHQNFHTAIGRYKPFAELLRRDGYRVGRFRKAFSAKSLEGVDVLVISNALAERNARDWSLPNASAFTREEIASVRTWVEKGGSLLLIADHMPFPGAASDLTRAFEVQFSNGHARAGHWKPGKPETFEIGTGLKESTITLGRSGAEKVTKVTTFTGSAFKLPKGATAVLVFGARSESEETKEEGKDGPKTVKVPIEGWCQGAILTSSKGRLSICGEAALFS
jgi:hypothetical protein